MGESTARETELQEQLTRTHEQLTGLLPEVGKLVEEVAALQTENQLLREKVDALLRRIYGPSSERLTPEQLELLLEGLTGKAAEPVAEEAPRRSAVPSPPRSKGRPRWPEDLPIVREVIVPEPVKACPEAWREIGSAEVTVQLDYEPARFFERHIVRPKYVRREQPLAAPIIGELATLQDRGIAAPGLLAAILVGKYCDHLPLYRQEQIFATRHGVHLSRQTLAQWVGLSADWLRPIYEVIRTGVLGGGYVQVDETPIEYLCPGHGQTKQGYFWVCARPGGDAVFAWHPSRAAECLEKIIPGNFTGTLQTDGYSAYGAFARARNAAAGQEVITLAGCWAHARRGIFEARESAPRHAGWLLGQIGQLYAIEARLRAQPAGPRLRAATRAADSQPILRRLERALPLLRAKHLPQSALGKALTYLANQWPLLQACLADGRLELDNNLVENAIRPTALGKKNWLFIGAEDVGERGAILYTIIESCRRRGLNPFEYLREVLTRLPKTTNWQVAELTPEAWAKARKTRPVSAAA